MNSGSQTTGGDELADLRRYVKDASDQPFGDLESVVRLACLAMMLNKTRTAKKLLLEASEEHRHRARLARKRAASRAAFKSRLGGLYSMVLARCEAEQEICIANQLKRLHRDWDSLTQEILELWEPKTKIRRRSWNTLLTWSKRPRDDSRTRPRPFLQFR